MNNAGVMLITGTRKGIGRYLAEYYVAKGYEVVGCSRSPVDYELENYTHYCLDITDEARVKKMFGEIRGRFKRLDVLINNAGVASMNHILLTPMKTVNRVFATNAIGPFLFCREAAKLMQKNKYGRIVNFSTIAIPLKLHGESTYASSKAAVVSLTEVLARDLAEMGITINAVGPGPVKTDLIRSIPKKIIDALLDRQAIRKYGEYEDITNVVDFFISPKSSLITGQVIYLGGV